MTETSHPPSVTVIGGGISGLTTAHLLKEKGFSVRLLEKRESPGGVIQSRSNDGWLTEQGPNTIMARSARLWDLIEQLGLQQELVRTGKEASKRYIVKDGRPLALPQSFGDFFTTNLLSASAKFRLFKEPFIAKGKQAESIANFFERRLGKEVVDYAVNPFVAGIFAGDPKLLSARHTLSKVYELEQQYGSIMKGAIKSRRKKSSSPKKNDRPGGLISFKNGIQQLPEALRSQLGSDICFGSSAKQIKQKNSRWLTYSADQAEPVTSDALVFTAPLHQLSAMELSFGEAQQAQQLASMPYAPIAVVSLGFPREAVGHPLDGFGVLVPEVENFNILGCLFSSSLFEGRAPEGHVLLTCFVGGQRNPAHASLGDKELLPMVLDDLKALLDCPAEPVFTRICRWKNAIPQYNMDHQHYLDIMSNLESENPGLYLTGNFRHEVSVPGCINQAYETANRIATFFES